MFIFRFNIRSEGFKHMLIQSTYWFGEGGGGCEGLLIVVQLLFICIYVGDRSGHTSLFLID